MGLNSTSRRAPRTWPMSRLPPNQDLAHIMQVLTRVLRIDELMQRAGRAKQRPLCEQTTELAKLIHLRRTLDAGRDTLHIERLRKRDHRTTRRYGARVRLQPINEGT